MSEDSNEVMVRYCYAHPGVETLVSCAHCDQPLCTKCMIYTPVGIKCRQCARMRRLPQYEVGPSLLGRVLALTLLAAVVVGLLLSFVPGSGFVSGVLAGFILPEVAMRLSRGKRGREMQILCSIGVAVALVASLFFLALRLLNWSQPQVALQAILTPDNYSVSTLIGLLAGVYLVVQRCR